MPDPSKTQIVSFILKNSRTTSAVMPLRLSPARASFSGDYVLEPGDSVRIRAWGSSPGELTLELVDQGLLVRDWPNSVVCVSSMRLLHSLPRERLHLRIAPSASLTERLHPSDDFEEDTKPGER